MPPSVWNDRLVSSSLPSPSHRDWVTLWESNSDYCKCASSLLIWSEWGILFPLVIVCVISWIWLLTKCSTNSTVNQLWRPQTGPDPRRDQSPAAASQPLTWKKQIIYFWWRCFTSLLPVFSPSFALSLNSYYTLPVPLIEIDSTRPC